MPPSSGRALCGDADFAVKKEITVTNPPVRTFRDLIAWQKAKALGVLTYRVLESMPAREQFGLTSQISRAATSVSGNIAEGFGLGTQPQFLKHLRIARGSLFESASHLDIAAELGMVQLTDDWCSLWAETDRVLQGLIFSVERSVERGDL